MITKQQALTTGQLLDVDFDIISPETLRKGMKVELEHGRRLARTNITGDDLIMTAMIALAHLSEFPDYYDELAKMEQRLDKRWKNKKKPSIFNRL
jgi:hypothetical protein